MSIIEMLADIVFSHLFIFYLCSFALMIFFLLKKDYKSLSIFLAMLILLSIVILSLNFNISVVNMVALAFFRKLVIFYLLSIGLIIFFLFSEDVKSFLVFFPMLLLLTGILLRIASHLGE